MNARDIGAALQRLRDAGHRLRLAVRVNRKPFAVRPHIGTVVRDENGDIAEQQHTALVGIAAQLLPLPIEQELLEANLLDLLGQVGALAGQRGSLAVADGARPLVPGLTAVRAAQRLVESEILQPTGVFAGKAGKGLSLVGAGPLLETMVGNRETHPALAIRVL